MASRPVITFKAGQCTLEGKKVKPVPGPGYIYLYNEDDLTHFCWRPRSAPSTEPELDLIMFPGDGSFTPYLGSNTQNTSEKHSPTNGRIYVLKFASSSERHFFWMQSKSQHKDGTPSWFSQRDQNLGDIVNQLLQGEEVDVQQEIAGIRQNGGNNDPDGGDDDQAMDDVTGPDHGDEHHRQGSGGAGQDATGGDPREEGEDSRRGGADGGRAAANDPNDVVQNFLRSLQGSNTTQQQAPQQAYDQPFTSLPELLNTDTTVAFLSSASPAQIDALCTHLPPSIFLLAQESEESLSGVEPSAAAHEAAIEAMSTEQKRELIERVLRSPQLHQSLGSLTVALRDGGLPMIGDALGVDIPNGGLIKGGSVPLGGGQAVAAFLEGVKRSAEKDANKR